MRDSAIAFNRTSDIVFEDLMNLYQICTAKSNLASDNPLCFKNNFQKKYTK